MTSTLTPPTGTEVSARLRELREASDELATTLVGVGSDYLAVVAAEAAALLASVEALHAAVVIESADRGVIASSDHPRPQAWVEQAARDGDVPVTTARSRALHEIVLTCRGLDVEQLRAAIIEHRVPLDTAAALAKVYRRLRSSITYDNGDELLRILIEYVADGASVANLKTVEDALIGQYGPDGELDREHELKHATRELTPFVRDRDGMLIAKLRLDPASAAQVTANLNALSAPRPSDDGTPDDRTAGQRRADAFLALVGTATEADPTTPGSGRQASIVVTMRLDQLRAQLDDHGERTGNRGYATTLFGETLSPEEARLAACDAEVIPAVLGQRGELLDLGRAARTITPGQRTALTLRDEGCSYPGCTMPPAWCDGHHIHHWADGGPTNLDNMALLCRHHHTVVHQHGHTATVDKEHGVRWARADGTPIGTTPRPGGSGWRQ